MIRSLWIAKTGLDAQQMQLDTISHNLANVSTNGYKRSHAVFEDLLYQNMRQAGAASSGYTPARRISKIPDSQYRALAATGIRSGSVGVTIKVNTDGSVSNCRIARSSGDGSIDGLMCRLTLQFVRFQPARDNAGRPVAQDITFFPNWYRP